MLCAAVLRTVQSREEFVHAQGFTSLSFLWPAETDDRIVERTVEDKDVARSSETAGSKDSFKSQHRDENCDNVKAPEKKLLMAVAEAGTCEQQESKLLLKQTMRQAVSQT